ncbi:hypothetical protein [Enterococcus sp. HY326]|uniref:hypothetical protein n=1 Tax=Enterococcus sp. HY326 TaxID=2971265 RepID=UPI00223F46D7|nr:hypothetical protein [Enterococcus sp. HY326]
MINIQIKPSTNTFVAKEICNFVDWLEANYDFPRVIYLNVTGANFIRNKEDGTKNAATIFLPFSPFEHAQMNISTGDFFSLVKEQGKDNAIYTTLESISHEVQHYYQWLDNLKLDETEAEEGAAELTYEYVDERGFIFPTKKKSWHY